MNNWRDAMVALPLGSGVRVVGVDSNGLGALEKPEGLLSQPNTPKDRARSLLAADYDANDESYRIDRAGAVERAWLLNRLDSATSGLILIALDREVADAVRRVFRDRKVRKVYRAVAFGHARVSRQSWIDRMKVKGVADSVRAVDTGPLKAETDMRRLRLIPGPPALSLLELIPRTGRTHQLRFQCSKHRLPIVGDQTYGDFRANREFARRAGTKRLFLHSSEIRFEYRYEGRSVRFEAESEIPQAFRSVL
jgi:23S rRNA-/tRNA-specific pseudouridylate synthase